jgi:hypothetical protein
MEQLKREKMDELENKNIECDQNKQQTKQLNGLIL